jgi:hypothetical protein
MPIILYHRTRLDHGCGIVANEMKVDRWMIAQDRCANFTEHENDERFEESGGCVLKFAWHGPVAGPLPAEVAQRQAGVLYRADWRSVIVPVAMTGLEFLDAAILRGHEAEYDRTILARLLRRGANQQARAALDKYRGRYVPVSWAS